MSTSFTIDPDTDRLTIDPESRTGSMLFSVQNRSGHARQIKASAQVPDPEHASWYEVAEPIRAAGEGETLQFSLTATVPPEVPAQDTRVQLKVVGEDDPDDVWAESQNVTVSIPEVPEDGGSSFPWWLVAVGAAVVVVLGIIGFLVVDGDDGGGAEDLAVEILEPEPGDVLDADEESNLRETKLAARITTQDGATVDRIFWVNDDGDPLAAAEATPAADGTEGVFETSTGVEFSGGCPDFIDHEVEILVLDSLGRSASDTVEFRVQRTAPVPAFCTTVTFTIGEQFPQELLDDFGRFQEDVDE